jgi:predicted Zn-dependent protease
MTDRLKQAEAWLAAHPDDRFARYTLALEWMKHGRPAEAIGHFEQLLARFPHSAAGHLQHVRAWRQAGDRARALAACREGLALLAASAEPDAARGRRELQAELDDLHQEEADAET